MARLIKSRDQLKQAAGRELRRTEAELGTRSTAPIDALKDVVISGEETANKTQKGSTQNPRPIHRKVTIAKIEKRRSSRVVNPQQDHISHDDQDLIPKDIATIGSTAACSNTFKSPVESRCAAAHSSSTIQTSELKSPALRDLTNSRPCKKDTNISTTKLLSPSRSSTQDAQSKEENSPTNKPVKAIKSIQDNIKRIKDRIKDLETDFISRELNGERIPRTAFAKTANKRKKKSETPQETARLSAIALGNFDAAEFATIRSKTYQSGRKATFRRKNSLLKFEVFDYEIPIQDQNMNIDDSSVIDMSNDKEMNNIKAEMPTSIESEVDDI